MNRQIRCNGDLGLLCNRDLHLFFSEDPFLRCNRDLGLLRDGRHNFLFSLFRCSQLCLKGSLSLSYPSGLFLRLALLDELFPFSRTLYVQTPTSEPGGQTSVLSFPSDGQ